MFKTFLTALRLMWISIDSRSLRIRFFGNFVFGIAQGVIAFLTPLCLSFLVKDITEGDINGALFYFYGLVVLAGLLIISRFIWRYACEYLVISLPLNLKQIYYKKIFDKPYDWHLHNSVGYFSTALDRVCKNIGSWLCKMPFDYIGSFVMTFCFLIYTLIISPYLFIYFVAFFPVMIGVIRILYNKRLKYINAYAISDLSYGKSFIDFLYNIRSVKKMNLLEFVNKNVRKKAEVVSHKGHDMYKYNAYQWGFMELFINAQFLIPLGYYIYSFITTGQDIEIVIMIASIRGEMARFGQLVMHLMYEIAHTKTEYTMLSEHLDEDFSFKEDKSPIKKWHKIIFENTVFDFVKDDNLFRHRVADFVINRGDHIAVVGKSGEGKSTFLNLLTNQFTVQGGFVKVDEVNYKDLPESFFYEKLTYISQDVELFNMTLYDNIVMGKKVPKEKLQKIIDGCCLNELIERMCGNIHTDIGEKGVKVSGGEKQRINLARGLLLDREILVLDEITANLDPYTTEKIWRFIFEEYGDKTIIAVSHEKELLNFVNRKIEFKKGTGKEI